VRGEEGYRFLYSELRLAVAGSAGIPGLLHERTRSARTHLRFNVRVIETFQRAHARLQASDACAPRSYLIANVYRSCLSYLDSEVERKQKAQARLKLIR
jgi:hypothetical protein